MRQDTLIHIGTSGWHYNHWQGSFYPAHLPKHEFLTYYQKHFHTVEINNSFYRLPAEQTLQGWRERVPPGFIFAVKGSRYITHLKKLQAPQEALKLFLDRIQLLKDRLGPILFQLPPRWRFNAERLRTFLKALPRDYRYAFEFRDPSWWNREAFGMMAEHGAAFCIHELAGRISPVEVTAAHVYLRLHGPQGPYEGKYDDQTLAGWARAISAWVSQGREVFCYFDNDERGYAVHNAQSLQRMLV